MIVSLNHATWRLVVLPLYAPGGIHAGGVFMMSLLVVEVTDRHVLGGVGRTV